jgi:drug/metabolite transporter (DMT)-like permease
MTSRLRFYATWGLLLALDVAIQVAMKLAGDQLHGIPPGSGWLSAALSSWLVWLSLAGYVATFVLWLAILHASPLSAAFPATALVYVLVPLAGWLLLGEAFSFWQAIGIALILAGVVLQRGHEV